MKLGQTKRLLYVSYIIIIVVVAEIIFLQLLVNIYIYIN